MYCRYVCMYYVCMSARIAQKPHVQISPNFLYMLPVAVARSLSDGNAKCVTLCLLHYIIHVCFDERMGQNQTTRKFRPVRQMAAPRAKSAISDRILFVRSSLYEWVSTAVSVSHSTRRLVLKMQERRNGGHLKKIITTSSKSVYILETIFVSWIYCFLAG